MRLVATPARGFRVHIPFPAEGEGFQAGRADARFVSALSGEHAGRDRAREEQRRRSGYPSSDEAEVAAGPLSAAGWTAVGRRRRSFFANFTSCLFLIVVVVVVLFWITRSY